MSIKAIFKCKMPSCNYIFRDGTTGVFISGKLYTDNNAHISELKAEVGEVGVNASKHPHIYVDPDECEIDSEMMDPIEVMKAKLRLEVRAEMAAATSKGDMGSTDQSGGVLKGMVSTATLAEAQGVSNSSDAPPLATQSNGAPAGSTSSALSALAAKLGK